MVLPLCSYWKGADTSDLIEREFPPCNDPIEREFHPFSHLFKENRHNGTYTPAASIPWWAAWAPPRLQPVLQCTSLHKENQHNTCLFTWACGAQLIAQSSRALSPPVPPPTPPHQKQKTTNQNKNNNNNKPNRPRLQYVLFKITWSPHVRPVTSQRRGHGTEADLSHVTLEDNDILLI